MKTIVFSIAMISVMLSACTDNNNAPKENQQSNKPAPTNDSTSVAENNQSSSVDEVVAAYLDLKNALTADNGKEAAEAGKHLYAAMGKLDNGSFTADQKNVYNEVQEDIKEHAEHISSNAEKIAHQREHFETLSKDMYDLVKSVKPSQPLYKDHCPMYNDNKGADWLSEVKEIKNPYLGKNMPNCGEVKEEIR